jgi:hypothetical protein
MFTHSYLSTIRNEQRLEFLHARSDGTRNMILVFQARSTILSVDDT